MKNNHGYHYLVLGAGRQGSAAAYDLVKFGNANKIILADNDLERAQKACSRVNRLTGSGLVEAQQVDVTDTTQLKNVLLPADAVLSAVPYYHNQAITRAAIETHTHLCDMGGHTETVRAQMQLENEARLAGISLVPDCGMGPGLVNTLGAYVIELLDQTREVFIFDAGLPQNPIPPWNYALTFHINGLTNEMDGQAVFIRDGKICYVDTLSEPEMIDFPPFGLLEADVTSGGTSLAPWTYLGKLERYENKVMRFPGHYEWLRAFKKLGLFSEQPIRVEKQTIIPRQVYHALLSPQITFQEVKDICIMRATGKGMKDQKQATVTVDLVDRYDSTTGFTGMERLTGWHCAIMLSLQAQNKVQPGASPVELAVPASQFMQELKKRGIDHHVSWN